MKLAKYAIRALLLVVALVATALQAPAASAASAYDDYYHTVSPLVLHNNPHCTPIDISNTWSTYIRNSQYGSSFATALSSGSWGVSQLTHWGVDNNGNPTVTPVIVYWSPDTQMSIDWMSWGSMVARTPAVVAMIMLSDSGGVCSVTISNYGAGYISSNDRMVENYLFTGDVSYPSGYDGPLVVTSPPAATYRRHGRLVFERRGKHAV